MKNNDFIDNLLKNTRLTDTEAKVISIGVILELRRLETKSFSKGIVIGGIINSIFIILWRAVE